jgi:hypothetical protein
MALLSALLATVLLTTLGLALALLGMEESMLALHERTARVLRQAASAAGQLALADLRGQPVWDKVLATGAAPPLSALPGRFVDDTLTPRSPWNGVPLDLGALTSRLQAATDGDRGPADAPQVWRLYEYGPLDRAAAVPAGPWYVAVWIADDRADIDSDPSVDSNGLLSVHAAALGPADAMMAVDLTVQRLPSGRVRVATVRPGS